MVKAVLAVVGNVNIWPAIVVKVTDGNSESPALIRDAGMLGHIGEGAIVIVVIERRAWRLLLSGQRIIGGTIVQINIGPAIVVIIENGDSRPRRFQNVFFLGRAGDVL